MTGQAEEGPAGVPEKAKQAGDIRARWAWAEPTVWTDRMLAALENGVIGREMVQLDQRWPNSFFIEQGLFTMTIAHAGSRQPA